MQSSHNHSVVLLFHVNILHSWSWKGHTVPVCTSALQPPAHGPLLVHGSSGLGRTEGINYLHYFIYLFSGIERCVILKDYQIVFCTSVYWCKFIMTFRKKTVFMLVISRSFVVFICDSLATRPWKYSDIKRVQGAKKVGDRWIQFPLVSDRFYRGDLIISVTIWR